MASGTPPPISQDSATLPVPYSLKRKADDIKQEGEQVQGKAEPEMKPADKEMSSAQQQELAMRQMNQEIKAIELEQLTRPTKKLRKDLSDMIATCFHITNEDFQMRLSSKSEPIHLKNIMSLVNDFIIERFRQREPITESEIKEIYALFFETDLKSFSEEALSKDPLNPHPCEIFKSLYQCLKVLDSFASCHDAAEKATGYAERKPDKDLILEELIAKTQEEKEQFFQQHLAGQMSMQDFTSLLAEYQQKQDAHQVQFRRFPVIDTRLWNVETSIPNLNNTYLLQSIGGNRKWIFKPFEENPDKPFLPLSEHTASLVNFNHRFPIPLTLLLNIREWTGSAQVFIEGAIPMDQLRAEQKLGQIEPIEIQKLIIFDLLFGNGDRHQGNMLFLLGESGLYTTFGIDHDRCFQRFIEPLKLEYEGLPSMYQPFSPSLADLVSQEAQDEYEKMMRIHKMPEEMIAWMRTAASAVANAIENGENVSETVRRLKESWETKLFGEEIIEDFDEEAI